MKEQFLNDIPLATAIAAHNGTSFSPETRGAKEREGYAETMVADYEMLAKFADTPEKKALLEQEFTRYRQGYKAKNVTWLISRSRCLSTMIAGPSNFPVRRAEKANTSAHNKMLECIEFRKRALAAIEKKLRPEIRPIMSGDSDAVSRLAHELAAAEAKQEVMKTANGIIRRNKNGTAAGLLALEAAGFTPEHAQRLYTKDAFGGFGYSPWELTNNNANIRRMKDRLLKLTAAKAAPIAAGQGEHARYEDDPPANRIRLFFPGKPSEEIRSKMKSGGFKWAPTIGAWQAYRNDRTFRTAREVAGIKEQADAEKC